MTAEEIEKNFGIVPGSFADYENVKHFYDKFPDYKEGLEWIREFISKPDKNLGRTGDICPFTTPAMQQNLLKFVSIKTIEASALEAAEQTKLLVNLFFELFQGAEKRSRAALLAFFPDIPRTEAAGFIDGGHRIMRLEFVKNGLMLGEFHAKSEVGSVRNERFKVMQCPVPMFVVRALSAHDIKFLDRPIYPIAERHEYLVNYKRYLSPTLPPQLNSEIDKRILALKEDKGFHV